MICEDNLSNEEICQEVSDNVARIFGETLGIDIKEVGLTKHFIFDLGGTSLDYISLLVKLKAEYNIEFNFDDVSMSTVEQFSKYIMKNKLDNRE